MIQHRLDGAVELAEGEMAAFEAGGVEVLVCRVKGILHAVENVCSHQATALTEGTLNGHLVTCPLHFAEFDVRDGSPHTPPAFASIRAFPITPDGIVTIDPDSDPYGGLDAEPVLIR